jgi:hypothetical protein
MGHDALSGSQTKDAAYLEQIMITRYGKRGICPECDRVTNWSRVKSKRAFACQWCGHHISPCVGTILESSRIPLHVWADAIHLFKTRPDEFSAKRLQIQLGLTGKSSSRIVNQLKSNPTHGVFNCLITINAVDLVYWDRYFS